MTSTKINSQHLLEFRRALSYSELENKRINALICTHASADKIEMNRMINKNNKIHNSYELLFEKVVALFESQYDSAVVEPFTSEEIEAMNSLFSTYVNSKEKELDSIINLCENSVVKFSVKNDISRTKIVFEDIVQLFKDYGK